MVVRKTYERFGLETNFEQLQYSQSVMFEKKIYFISSSDEYDSDFINYNITIYIVPEVKMLKRKTILKKCFYCKKRHCDAKFISNGEFCHYQCGADHKFNVKCPHLHETFENNIVLYEKPTVDEEDNCVVCFEECKTITKCGHRVCRDCVNKIHAAHGSNLTCPMCRGRLDEGIPAEEEIMEHVFDNNVIRSNIVLAL